MTYEYIGNNAMYKYWCNECMSNSAVNFRKHAFGNVIFLMRVLNNEFLA